MRERPHKPLEQNDGQVDYSKVINFTALSDPVWTNKKKTRREVGEATNCTIDNYCRLDRETRCNPLDHDDCDDLWVASNLYDYCSQTNADPAKYIGKYTVLKKDETKTTDQTYQVQTCMRTDDGKVDMLRQERWDA